MRPQPDSWDLDYHLYIRQCSRGHQWVDRLLGTYDQAITHKNDVICSIKPDYLKFSGWWCSNSSSLWFAHTSHCERKALEIEWRLYSTTDNTAKSFKREIGQRHTWSTTIVWRRVTVNVPTLAYSATLTDILQQALPYDTVLSFTQEKTSRTLRVRLRDSFSAQACESLSPALLSDVKLKNVLLFMQADLESKDACHHLNYPE